MSRLAPAAVAARRVIRAPIATAALAVALAACGSAPGPTVYSGATIIPIPGAEPVLDGDVVVVDGRVTCVGASGACETPAGAATIDVSGLWLIPGLIDTHIHATFGGAPGLAERDQRLRFLLGVTLTRDASTARNFDGNIDAAHASSASRLPVPRLLVSGRAHLDRIEAGEAVEPLVAELVDAGASAIKVHDPFTAPQLVEIGNAARSSGVPVYGHAWAEDPVRSLVTESIDAGFDGLAHVLGISPLALPLEVRTSAPDVQGAAAWRVWRRSLWIEASVESQDSIARSLAARGLWIEPLITAEAQWAEPYRPPEAVREIVSVPFVSHALEEWPGAELSTADRDRLSRSMGRVYRFIRTFHEAGGVLVTGSDGVVAPGLAIHEELRQLTQAGLSPGEALAAATIQAARILEVADSLGSIEPGKLADFVLLEGDPLQDITNTLRIVQIVKAGVRYRPAKLLDELKP
jgi:imidazolonepropionase-like amidohydrolase